MADANVSTGACAFLPGILQASDKLCELSNYLHALNELSPDAQAGLLPVHFHAVIKQALVQVAEVSGLVESVRVAAGGAA